MSAAADLPTCPTCGGELAANAPEGLCAKCVVEVMMNFAGADPGSFEDDDEDEVTLLTATAKMGQVGDYEILEKIAAGGMGVVYRARQQRLGRMVALKLVAEGKLAADTDKERFLHEARAAGELDHPNILPIYEVGEDDGQYYFSMPLVTGGSLSDWLFDHADGSKSGSFRDRQIASAKILQKIANAVHYAHGQGILHRDLKPANILIDHHGEPQVSDFGLAKRVADDTHLTISGQLLGSPAYMSPEQAEGKNHELTPAADVYAIGAMLYQALTGRIPFDGDSPMALLQETLTKEPKPLRKCNPRIDRDLETITLKCLEKVPGDRYASAEGLAEDLGRWLDGRPILAKPAGVARRSVKWIRRKPAVAAAVSIAVLASVLLVGMAWRHQREQKMKGLADYPDDIRLAHEHVGKDQIREATAILAKQAEEDREFAWRWLSARCATVPRVELGQGQVHALTPALAAAGNVLIQGADGTVRSWDLEGSVAPKVFEGGAPASADQLRFDGGRAFLLTQGEQDRWRVRLPTAERRDGKLAAKLVPPPGGFLAAVPGKRPSLFVQTRGKRGDGVLTWAPPWRQGISQFELSGDLQALAVSSKSQNHERYYVAACYSSKIELWQWEEDVFFRKATIQRKPSPSAAIAFSPNGRLLLVGDASGMIRGWNRRSLEIDLELQHSGPVQALTTVDRDAVHHVVASTEEGELRAWPLRTPSLNIGTAAQPPFGFSEDGEWIVYRQGEGTQLTVRPVARAKREPFGEVPESGTLEALALLSPVPPVALAITRSAQGTLSGTRITEDRSVPVLEDTLSQMSSEWLDQSVHGPYWYVLGADGQARVIDLRDGSRRLIGGPGRLSGKKVRIFGGETALWSSMDGNLITLESASGVLRRLKLSGAAAAMHLAVSPDRQTLAVAHEDGKLRLWHGESGQLLIELPSHPWQYLQFSPSGNTLVGYESGGNESNGSLRFFDARPPNNSMVR